MICQASEAARCHGRTDRDLPVARHRPGSSALHRLRISLSAAHTTEDVEALVAALGRCGLPLRPPPRALHADHTARLHEAVTVDSAAASGERAPAAAAGSAADPRARL